MKTDCHENSHDEKIKSHLAKQLWRGIPDDELTAPVSLTVWGKTIEIGSDELVDHVLADASTMRICDEIEMLGRKKTELESEPDRGWETEQHIRAIDSAIPHLIEGIERGVARCRDKLATDAAIRRAEATLRIHAARTRARTRPVCVARVNRNTRAHRTVRVAAASKTTKSADGPDGPGEPPGNLHSSLEVSP